MQIPRRLHPFSLFPRLLTFQPQIVSLYTTTLRIFGQTHPFFSWSRRVKLYQQSWGLSVCRWFRSVWHNSIYRNISRNEVPLIIDWTPTALLFRSIQLPQPSFEPQRQHAPTQPLACQTKLSLVAGLYLCPHELNLHCQLSPRLCACSFLACQIRGVPSSDLRITLYATQCVPSVQEPYFTAHLEIQSFYLIRPLHNNGVLRLLHSNT
ncbi:hypothetical protein BDD12DRAFT_361468 [Trichophaea hybrida]|nr:hypothetical protein BDD12DRAFT_361468 [Trichophaea hybrida]